MTQFINIEGTLINLDNVTHVLWLPKSHSPLTFVFDALSETEQHYRDFKDTPATRAAYEWVKGRCVATFTDEAYGADSVQICPICGNKYESQTGLDYHLAHYHQAEGEAQS